MPANKRAQGLKQSRSPCVTIALCTFNAAKYLDAQLASYASQYHRNWRLWVSDDGSRDTTLDIVHAWAERWRGEHEVTLIQGPGKHSAAANFMSLLCHPDLPADPVAISDHDDVWYPHKLTRALSQIRAYPTNRPVLYGAQSRHTDEVLRPIGRSRYPARPPTFANALVQNIVSGNTAVLSSTALELVRCAGVPSGIAYHDWWLYQLLSGAGAEILIDDQLVLDYRQHASNVMGANRGTVARLSRIKTVFDGTYRDWIFANLLALQQNQFLLGAPHRRTVQTLLQDRQVHACLRYRTLRRLRLHRQGRLDTAFLGAAALLRRL